MIKKENIDKIVDPKGLKEELKGRTIIPDEFESMLCISRRGTEVSAIIFGSPFDLAELSCILEEKMPENAKLIRNAAKKIVAAASKDDSISKIIEENASALFELFLKTKESENGSIH